KQFRVKAAAIGIKDGYVRLHKEDGTEVSVPIEKLSSSDQRLLKQARSQAGPEVPELPAVVEFQRNNSGWSASWNNASDLSQVAPDSPPSFASVPMKGVGFMKGHFFEDLIRVEPIGGSDGWMLAGTVDGHGDLPSRLLWASLSAGKVKRIQFLPNGERVAAVDPPNRLVLSLNKEGPRLTLWKADPTMEMVEPIKSWISISEDNWGSWNNWAEIVASNRVLHEWGKHRYVVWDTDKQVEVYRIDQESFFSAQPVLSPGKRYLALPEDERVRVIESATGNTLAVLPIEGGRSSGAGFSPDGKQLAVLTKNQLAVWTLGSSQPPARYRADTVGTPFTATVEWVDENLLLIDRSTLFDLRLELPVWNYAAKTFEVQSDSWGERTQSVLGNKLCYAVEVRSGSNSGFIVGAVELPGPGVREAVDNLDPESLYIIRRGHPVGIEVNCGSFDSQVRQALMKQITDNGWVYDQSSTTVLTAKMGRSETQTIEYKSMRGGGATQRVTVTPFYSTMKLMYGTQVAWQRGGGSGAPSVMFLNEGETAQSRANAMQKPYPGLFSDVDVPEKIFDPAKKKGIGSSLISSQGLTPQ
ncbi:MAG: SHD1 domain-containing protein, partial [Planctomycetota bacterium]